MFNELTELGCWEPEGYSRNINVSEKKNLEESQNNIPRLTGTIPSSDGSVFQLPWFSHVPNP